MLRHVVLFRWKDDVTDDQRAAVTRGLGGLPAAIPQIRRYEFGEDAGLGEGNFDFVVVADFDSLESYRAYQAHPDHLRVIDEAIRPAISARAGSQYWLTDSA